MTSRNKNGAFPTAIENARKGSLVHAEPLSSLTLSERRAFFRANDVRPERGEFIGDGVPRDFSGKPYKPLEWGTP